MEEMPIRFTGVLIGKGTTKNHNSTRWTDVAIYRTEAGNYIAAIQRHTQRGESDCFSAASKQTDDEIIEWHILKGASIGRMVDDIMEGFTRLLAALHEQPDVGFQAAWGQTLE